MEDLERAGLLDVEVEALPDAEELARRRPAGAGLSRPELAVLLAYARSELARSIDSSPLPRYDALRSCGVGYFPPAVTQAFSDLIPEHPLFRQLVSSELADELIARMGAVWAHEVAAETGRQPWEAAAAYWAAREVLGAGPLFEEVDTVAWTVSPEAESRAARLLELRPGPAGAVVPGAARRRRPDGRRLRRAPAWPSPLPPTGLMSASWTRFVRAKGLQWRGQWTSVH